MLIRRRDIRRGVGVDVSERCLDAPADQHVAAVEALGGDPEQALAWPAAGRGPWVAQYGQLTLRYALAERQETTARATWRPSSTAAAPGATMVLARKRSHHIGSTCRPGRVRLMS
jgi:hypothetical protein